MDRLEDEGGERGGGEFSPTFGDNFEILMFIVNPGEHVVLIFYSEFATSGSWIFRRDSAHPRNRGSERRAPKEVHSLPHL